MGSYGPAEAQAAGEIDALLNTNLRAAVAGRVIFIGSAGLHFSAVARREATLIPGAANRLIAMLGHLAPALTEELMRRTILDKLPQANAPAGQTLEQER